MSGVSQGEAMGLLAQGIEEVVGQKSEAYRDMLKAVESGQMVDLMLAQSSFDDLPGDVRKQIAHFVEDLVEQFDPEKD